MARKRSRGTPPSLQQVWISGLVAAAIAVAAIVVKSDFDHRHGVHHSSLVTWITVPVLLISGIYAVSRLADAMGRFLARRSIEAAAAVVRLVATGVGYLLVLIAVFELLGVSLAHLIIGFGLAGVVLGSRPNRVWAIYSPRWCCSSHDRSKLENTSEFVRAPLG
jgi:hypothetical protein